MADADRVQIVAQEIKPLGTDADVAFTAGDATNGHWFYNDGQSVLLVSSSAGGKTVTVHSVACEHGRTGNITLAPASGKIGSTGFLPPDCFNQTSALYIGKVFVDVSEATGVGLAVVKYVKE